MRSGTALAAWLVLSLSVLGAPRALAQAPSGETKIPPATDGTEAARTHFKTGMRLYQDQNYAGALAEFEAAYELKPGPGSLQNVALCQKALLRYGEAADTLTQLLTLHGAELSDAERSAAKSARDELEALVGSVNLIMVPRTAEVTVDGRPRGSADRSGRLRLNVGEHTLAASAPGYSSATTSVRVTSGQRDVPVDLTLVPTAGFVDVRSTDPSASIAIDGKPVAFGHFFGPVAPNEPHVVQIYKQGATPFEARVTVELGKTAIVNGEPGAALGGSSSSTPGTTAPASSGAPPTKPMKGWYGMGSVSLLATGATPFAFDLSSAKSGAFALGAHAGYRLRPAIALEGLLEYDVLKVRHACDEFSGQLAPTPILCSDDNAIFVNYLIRSFRFGPTLELMTTDPRLRALGGIGVGGVWHELRMGLNRRAGVDPYLLLELGIGANTKHVIFALTAQALIDGTRGMIDRRNIGTDDSVHETAFDRSGGALTYVGLNLRVGYSQWSP